MKKRWDLRAIFCHIQMYTIKYALICLELQWLAVKIFPYLHHILKIAHRTGAQKYSIFGISFLRALR
jgi:hypothetical protein